MAYRGDDFLKLIHDSKALSIWDRRRGPVFWYTAGVPGPFFVNTEWIIGRELSKSLVDEISVTIETATEPLARRAQLEKLLMSAYRGSSLFRDVIDALRLKALEAFPDGFDFVSGGERRDWIFSVPFAHEVAKPHIYLFKDLSASCEVPITPDARVLHIADLINNAASYFERWLPALEKIRVHCMGTVCVNSRGEGAQKLEQAGIPVAAMARIDLAFFQQSAASGLIEAETLAEIEAHARSPKEWAETYLLPNRAVFNVAGIDGKSLERLRSFLTHDPWALRAQHGDFFEDLQRQVEARKEAA